MINLDKNNNRYRAYSAYTHYHSIKFEFNHFSILEYLLLHPVNTDFKILLDPQDF